MKKLRSLLLIGLAVAMVCSLAACSGTSDQDTASEHVSDTVSVTSEGATESNSQVPETSSEAASEPAYSEAPDKTVSAGGSSSGSSASKSTGTGNQKKTSDKKKETTTRKETNTKKETTTKKETPAINPSEIQSEINAYIASKGWEVNSSLTPSNAGWSDRISINGDLSTKEYIIENLKWLVDEFPPSFGKYCYFDGKYFYVLYD